ncbi:MAG: PhoU domain-containing protein, partial [Promethearchaeota archaeon]
MEIRKIQSTASGSFFITLPKDWVTSSDIKKGDDLTISYFEDGALKILPLKKHEQYYSEFLIQIENYVEENSLERAISSSYVQGADIITISSKDTILVNIKKLIKQSTSNLIGTEISEEFANRIIIRILVDPVKFPLYILIKRIYTLVSSMHLDAIRAFQNSDEILANDVINRASEVGKLYYLMLRQLNLSLSNKINIEDICVSDMKIDCVLGIILARDLTKMAHYSVEIAKETIKLKDKEIDDKIKDHLVQMSRFIIKMQQNSILAFFKTDFMRANKVINNITNVRDFDNKTESDVWEKIEDKSTIISLITISKRLRDIANSAVEVSEDLQAKHRPQVT